VLFRVVSRAINRARPIWNTIAELEEHYLLCYPEPQDVKLVIYCNLAILKKRLTWNNGGQTIRILILTNGLLPSFSKLPNQKADDAAYSGRENMPTADRKLASESTGHWAQTVCQFLRTHVRTVRC
jgi:hypothetical protein